MEWIIGGLVFVFLAKQGLRRQGKSVDIKAAASDVAANATLEICDLLEIEVKDISKSKKS